MNTLYELFNVSEDATSDEIKDAYEKILKKAEDMPKTDKLTEKLRRIQIAYGILSNSEKRKKYDIDLSNKRAEELIKNVEIKSNSEEPKIVQKIEEDIELDEKSIKEEIQRQIDNAIKMQEKQEIQYMEEKLNEQKQKNAEEKYRRKLERKTRRLEKKNKELEKERQMNEYGRFLESQGYKVKYPWTWLKTKRLFVALFSTFITLFIMWHIPFVKNNLVNLYEENFIIHSLVNIFLWLINSITNLIKSLFK